MAGLIGEEVAPVSCRPPVHETIAGRYVDLIPTSEDHAEQLFEAAGGSENAALFDYMGYGPFHDLESLQESMATFAESTDPLFWTIRLRSTGTMVGWISFLRIDTANRVVEVGHVMFSQQLQRTTAATEAWFLLANKAFLEGYRRLEWKCNASNAASRKAALRLGHTFEGVFRKHQIVKGRNRDTAWFSIVDDEWPDRRAAMETWMDPSNFDGEGKQLRDLASFRGPT